MDNEDMVDVVVEDDVDETDGRDSQKGKETFKENSIKDNKSIVGDDRVFYSPEGVDELNSAIKNIYEDFYGWLKDIEATDELFDFVISPYSKGAPPNDKRFVTLFKKYVSRLDEAKKTFDNTLAEVIEYIDDYSRNKTLTVNATSTVVASTNKISNFTGDGDIDKNVDGYDIDRTNGESETVALEEDDENLGLDSDALPQVGTSNATNINVGSDMDYLEVNDNTMERLYDDSEDASEVSE